MFPLKNIIYCRPQPAAFSFIIISYCIPGEGKPAGPPLPAAGAHPREGICIMNCVKPLIVAILLALPAMSAAAQKTPDINSALDGAQWTTVNSKDNVKFGDKTWHGAKDLSFKYRLNVSGGTLFVQVEVTDDKVILKKTDAIASDHVELWLADASLVDAVAGKLGEIDTFTGKTLDGILDGADREKEIGCDEFRDTMQEIKLTKSSLKSDKRHVQLIFNQGRLLPQPGERLSAGAPAVRAISFELKPMPGGYSLSAAVPLDGLFDVRSPAIKELSWLIDVSDIDAPNAEKQKSLMSSSAKRRFDDPSSFSRLPVSPALELALTPHLKMLAALEPDSYLRADPAAPGGYRFLRDPGLFVLNCYDTVYDGLPANYVQFDLSPITSVSANQNGAAQIFANGPQIALLNGDKLSVVGLGDNLHASGAYEYSLLYRNDLAPAEGAGFGGANLLFEVTGASRYPMGNGMCGAGFESDAVSVRIGPDMKPIAVNSEHIDSCYNNISAGDVSMHKGDNSPPDGDVQIAFDTSEYDSSKNISITTHKLLTYTGSGPNPGFTVATTGTEEDKN